MGSALIPLSSTALSNSSFVPSTEEDRKNALEPDGAAYAVAGGALLWALGSTVGFGLAMALSYQRNESLLWAAGSGLVWPAYLIYRGVDYIND